MTSRVGRASLWGAGLCAALLLASGCGGTEAETPDVSADQVKQELGEAADAAADYAVGKRRQLEQRAQRAGDELDRELRAARERLADVPESLREGLEQAIARAERARDSLAEELGELEQASADRVEDARRGVTAALSEIAEAQREIGAALVEGPDAEKASEDS